MPEQFPGQARQAIRAFADSGATRAIVPAVDAGTLEETIAILGLSAELYAETRDEQTVLRKTAR